MRNIALFLALVMTGSAATSLTQYGITWTFAADMTTGQYANGDYYVVGPVTITSISPASTLISGRTINGAMVNPTAGTAVSQGFDSAMVSYVAALNAARPGGNDLDAGNPLVLPAGSSLVSTISHATAGVRPQLSDAAVLTVVASAPAANSFRPPYCGTDKTHHWNVSDLDYSKLASLDSTGMSRPSQATLESYMARPWIEIETEYGGRFMHPTNNQPDYGRDMTYLIGPVLLGLQTDFTNAQKETMLIHAVQYGLDIYGAAVTGGYWKNNGGHNMGRKPVLVLTGIVLGDANILEYADASRHFIFQEDHQTFYVDAAQQALVPYTADGRPRSSYATTSSTVTITNASPAVVTWVGHGLIDTQPIVFSTTGTLPSPLVAGQEYLVKSPTADTFQIVPYYVGAAINTTSAGSGTHTATFDMLGVAEWGEKHISTISHDGSNISAYYRDANFGSLAACALAIRFTLGGEVAWNWPPFFDYMDRIKGLTSPIFYSTFVNSMWSTYRDSYTPGVDTAPPTPSTATIVSVVPSGGGLFATATEASDPTSPIQYDFSCVPAGEATSWRGWQSPRTLLVSGLTASTTYDVRVRYRDGAGNVGTQSSITQATTAAPDLRPHRNPRNRRLFGR